MILKKSFFFLEVTCYLSILAMNGMLRCSQYIEKSFIIYCHYSIIDIEILNSSIILTLIQHDKIFKFRLYLIISTYYDVMTMQFAIDKIITIYSSSSLVYEKYLIIHYYLLTHLNIIKKN